MIIGTNIAIQLFLANIKFTCVDKHWQKPQQVLQKPYDDDDDDNDNDEGT